jgi:hypothetical protein
MVEIMLPTYKAILTANQIRWLETPPAWLPDQSLMIYITFLQEPPVVIPAMAEDPLLQLAGSIQSEVTDIGIRHDEYLGQYLVERHDEES